MPYDDREAKYLLAMASDALAPDPDLREIAAKNLVDAITALNGTAGFRCGVGRDNAGRDYVAISLPRASEDLVGSARISVIGNKVYALDPRDTTTSGVEVPVALNAETGEFEGVTADGYIASTPGEPRPVRSALAIVVLIALEIIQRKT